MTGPDPALSPMFDLGASRPGCGPAENHPFRSFCWTVEPERKGRHAEVHLPLSASWHLRHGNEPRCFVSKHALVLDTIRNLRFLCCSLKRRCRPRRLRSPSLANTCI